MKANVNNSSELISLLSSNSGRAPVGRESCQRRALGKAFFLAALVLALGAPPLSAIEPAIEHELTDGDTTALLDDELIGPPRDFMRSSEQAAPAPDSAGEGVVTFSAISVHPTGVSAYEQIPDYTFVYGDETSVVDLRNHFSFPGVEGPIVEFDTIVGRFAVELYDDEAPLNVANFLRHVNADTYSNTFVHRSVPGFVIQGGGYQAEFNLPAVTPLGTAPLEYNVPNYRGTLAMARAQDPDSASTQWFINTVDNSEDLKPLGEGAEGYTVIGRVLGFGLEAVDAIEDLPIYSLSDFFNQVPLYEYVEGTNLSFDNLAVVQSIKQIPLYPSSDEPQGLLTFSVISSNSQVAEVSIEDSELMVRPNGAGNAEVTVRATESGGYWSEIRFDVTVLIPTPIISSHPASQVLVAGQTMVLEVSEVSGGTVTYQWMKDGVDLPTGGEYGDTQGRTLEIVDFSADNAGRYAVRVSTSSRSVESAEVELSVVDQLVEHFVRAGAYAAGDTLQVDNLYTFLYEIDSLRWSVLLPDGWTFNSSDATGTESSPAADDSGLLEWTWTDPDSGQIGFTYYLNAPEDALETVSLVSVATILRGDVETQFMVDPDPLLVPRQRYHSMDTDQDFKVGLSELLRVIELYNARSGSTRTGGYTAQTGTVDGFAIDTRAPGSAEALASYHDADTNKNAQLDLSELLRVIELYNVRAGSTRTGSYRVRIGTVDGFDVAQPLEIFTPGS